MRNGFDLNGRRMAFAVGLTVGAATAIWYGWRGWRAWRAPSEPWPDPAVVLETARRALAGDDTLREQSIEVGLIAPGILDVAGVVDDAALGERALDLVRALPHVRTVLNRISVRDPDASRAPA
jgi:hypothetical protein